MLAAVNAPPCESEPLMRFWLLLFLLLAFIPALAQTVTDEPCPAPAQERSIHFCIPVDGSVVSSQLSVRAKVTDSRSVQVQFCIDSCPSEWGIESSGKDVIGLVGFGGSGWRRLIVRARDDVGEYQRAIWVNVSRDPPCTPGTLDNSITICTPMENETLTSPLRVAAAATDNDVVKVMLLYVNGVKQNHVRSGKNLSYWILLPPGRLRLTVWAQNSQNQTYKKTVNVNVAAPPVP